MHLKVLGAEELGNLHHSQTPLQRPPEQLVNKIVHGVTIRCEPVYLDVIHVVHTGGSGEFKESPLRDKIIRFIPEGGINITTGSGDLLFG